MEKLSHRQSKDHLIVFRKTIFRRVFTINSNSLINNIRIVEVTTNGEIFPEYGGES